MSELESNRTNKSNFLDNSCSLIENLPNKNDLHLIRKFWHMGSGALGLYLYLISGKSTLQWAIVTMIIALAGFLIEYLRFNFAWWKKMFLKLGAPFLRDSEKNSISGLPFYALGVSLSLFLFEKNIAILSILYLVFADPISSFVGIKLGKVKLVGGKSLEGTSAGFCTCFLLTAIYSFNWTLGSTNILLGFSILGAIVGSLAELFSIYLDDNLTIPVISGLGLTLINIFYPIF